jgi:hypothetical protein
MRNRGLFAICLILLLQQTVCGAQSSLSDNPFLNLFQKKTVKPGFHFYAWPVFFGGGTLFFSEKGPDSHYPGYSFSGGLTFSVYEEYISFFTDVLYSYRAYDGTPASDVSPVHFRIEETTADLALGVAYQIFYIGGYAQFPMNTMIKVREWTLDDFNGISRTPSFYFMGGIRTVGKHLGLDVRFLLGQGPGQFLRSSLGDHWLSQVSLGIMGGF